MAPSSTVLVTISVSPWWRSACRIRSLISSGWSIIKPCIGCPPPEAAKLLCGERAGQAFALGQTVTDTLLDPRYALQYHAWFSPEEKPHDPAIRQSRRARSRRCLRRVPSRPKRSRLPTSTRCRGRSPRPASRGWQNSASPRTRSTRAASSARSKLEIVPLRQQGQPAGVAQPAEARRSTRASATSRRATARRWPARCIEAVNKPQRAQPRQGDPVPELRRGGSRPSPTSKCSFWHFRFDANSDMKMESLTTCMARTRRTSRRCTCSTRTTPSATR